MFQTKLGAKNGAAARSIDHQFATEQMFTGAIANANANGRAARSEFDPFDACSLQDTGTLAGCVLEEQLVESAAIDVISVILGKAEFGNLAETDDMLALIGPMSPDGAVLVDEALGFHDRKEVDFLKDASR